MKTQHFNFLHGTQLLVFVFGLILASSSIRAQDALLWQVTCNNCPDTSFIYGTIHVKDSRVYLYADTVLSCMKRCTRLALELDFNPVNLLKLANLMTLPGDSTLADIFDPADMIQIKKVFEDITGTDFTSFEKLRPVVLLSVIMQFQTAGDTIYTLDEFLYRKGVNMNKEIVGLETVEEQFRLLESIPLDVIVKYLKNPYEEQEELELMVCYYTNSEIEPLLKLMKKDETMIALQDEFLDKRNIKMAEKTDSMFHEGPVLVAVGTGHLPGKNGIINLLRQRGFMVEPIFLKAPVRSDCDSLNMKTLN